MSDTASYLHLLIEQIFDEEDYDTDACEFYSRKYLKLYTYLDSLESCKEFDEEFPIYLELSNSEEYISDDEIGFSLTIEQAEDLANTLIKMVNFLK